MGIMVVNQKYFQKLGICTNRLCSYSLRGCNNLTVPRFNISIMKNSLVYRGTIMWNLVNDKEDCGYLSLLRV